ncbi:hypothetical protein HHI36_000321 [Cryptolaemus montrouzieri]|uniref:Uncharacterized protein n=1 Tax=Cryptolaemus montrouzieri TaxID=559131 RepID=A0ABD2P598_9CUCU
MTAYRKAVVDDADYDRESKSIRDAKRYYNGPLVSLTILWFTLSLCDFSELFGNPRRHIEDSYGLISAMFRYFCCVLGICSIFDICMADPYKYYS